MQFSTVENWQSLFDHVDDTLTFARFQAFDFTGMDRYPQVLEPLIFYVLHQLIYFSVAHGLVNDTTAWNWGHEAGAALANSLMAVVLFAVLDRFKIRT